MVDWSKLELKIEIKKPAGTWANVLASLVSYLRESGGPENELPFVREFANELAAKLIEAGLFSSAELQMWMRGELFPEDTGQVM